MKPKTVFGYINTQKADGVAPMQACKMALTKFADTPEKCFDLVHDVLGAEALYRWYVGAVSRVQDENIYHRATLAAFEVPGARRRPQAANVPQISVGDIHSTIANTEIPYLDPGTNRVRYVRLGGLDGAGFARVAAFYSAQAANHTARAAKWLKIAELCGKQTFETKFRTPEAQAEVLDAVFGDKENVA